MSRGRRGRRGHTPYRQSVPVQPCSDCDADAELTEVSPGVLVLEVRHDPTCPWLKQREVKQ